MALRQAGPIAAGLIAAGRRPTQPVAFVADATTPRQQVRLATLATAGARRRDAAAPAPPR